MSQGVAKIRQACVVVLSGRRCRWDVENDFGKAFGVLKFGLLVARLDEKHAVERIVNLAALGECKHANEDLGFVLVQMYLHRKPCNHSPVLRHN